VEWITGIQFPAPAMMEFFSSSPTRPDRFCGPLSLLFSGYRGSLTPRVKRLWREGDHSPPSSAEFKNAWSYTSVPSIHLHGTVIFTAQ